MPTTGPALNLLHLIANLLSILFLLRSWMIYTQTPMHIPPGRAVWVATQWFVVYIERIAPKNKLLVLYSGLIAAWLWQWLGLYLGSNQYGLLNSSATALTNVVNLSIQMLTILILINAILSWLNPQTTMMALANQLVRPVLDPIRQFIPPISGVDISPIVAIILLQWLKNILNG